MQLVARCIDRPVADSLALGFNAFLGIKYSNRAVEYTHRSLNFNGEVHVSRRIDQVDRVRIAIVFPRAGGRG